MGNSKKVAVIGLGNIGKIVASNLVKGKQEIIVADRVFQKAADLSKQLGNLAQPSEIVDAIKSADVIIFAIYFAAIKDSFIKYAAELQGKTIIDPSNPIAPDDKGGFKKIVGEKESSGQILAGLLPKDAKLVKAFGTLGAGSLENASFAEPKNVLFYATEESGLNHITEELIRDSGFEPLRVGGLDKSIRIEVFGDLHEFGALGKTVKIAEAKAKI